jgi:hypothetical protein
MIAVWTLKLLKSKNDLLLQLVVVLKYHPPNKNNGIHQEAMASNQLEETSLTKMLKIL